MAHLEFIAALQGRREIDITVTGRKSGKAVSLPVWFVQEGEMLYLLPAKGTDTQWYKNLCKIPSIRLDARGKSLNTNAIPSTEKASVHEVVKKFQDKYGARTVNNLYSGLNAAVEVSLK